MVVVAYVRLISLSQLTRNVAIDRLSNGLSYFLDKRSEQSGKKALVW